MFSREPVFPGRCSIQELTEVPYQSRGNAMSTLFGARLTPMSQRRLLAFVSTVVILAAPAKATDWKMDRSHSSLGFSVSHMVISDVSGLFREFSAEVKTDGEDFSTAVVKVIVQTASITTDNERRDTHLRSDDFFNSEKFPEARFVSTGVTKIGESDYIMRGNLTIRDTTHAVELKAKLNGIITDKRGNRRAGFRINGQIDRFAYGLKWNAVTEAGNLVAGERVTLNINLELVAEKPKE
jgi:polyisoprenoid-binding protein YceI